MRARPTSSVSSTLGTPSPEPISNVHGMDYSSLDPKFAAALDRLELVPQKYTQSDEQEVCPAVLALLQLSGS